MAKKISLEEAVRSLLAPKEQKMNISGRTDSNLSHNIEEDEQIDEIRGTATTTLGGEGLKRRMGLQRSGNQKRRVYEEATKIALKKVTEKKLALGKTATGQTSEPIDMKPIHNTIAGY
jgi:hypothetical protein